MNLRVLGLSLLLQLTAQTTMADSANIAVAANFTAPMRELAREFEKTSDHRLVLSFASSGKFYAQIQHGAPFDVFLSADTVKPERLIGDGLGEKTSRFTYALGALALWSKDPALISDGPETLAAGNFHKLALANPRLAPYGEAAMATLAALKLDKVLQSRLVQGENIAQAYQYVSSGNAELGFVARSQLWREDGSTEGSVWLVPASFHPPIRQDAVLLTRGADNPAALALLTYLRSEPAQAIIRRYGYGVE